MKQDFDFSSQTAGIKARTLIVAADADIFPPSHAVEMFVCSVAASGMLSC